MSDLVAEARRAAIVSLLQRRDDHLPEPVRRAESSSGFVHGQTARTRSCPDCLANGQVLKGCETCGGYGTITGGRRAMVAKPDALPDDESRLDPYTETRVLPYGFDPTKHDRAWKRDREIDRLGERLRLAERLRGSSESDELAAANMRGYAWEEARREMYRRFDFAALDRAMDELLIRDEFAAHALHAVYVSGLADVTVSLHAAAESGMRFLDERLPTPLRAPGVAEHPAESRQRRRRDEPALLAARTPEGDSE